jgi:hypothetical protein
MSVTTSRPQIAVWVKVPSSCCLAGEFDIGAQDDHDIHFIVGDHTDDVNLLFEREALKRFIALAEQMLALPTHNRRPTWPRLESPAA